MSCTFRYWPVLWALIAIPGWAPADIPKDQPPLEEVLSTPNQAYKLRRGLASTPHYMPTAKMYEAGAALDRSGAVSLGNPAGYHAGYVSNGFRTPYFKGSTKDIAFWACANNPDGFDCDNGFATGEQIIMPTDVYAKKSESCIRGIIGHELFHHVQFGYVFDGGGEGCSGGYGSAACEGHARALQDKIYSDLDLDPAASCVATFRGQVDGYMDQPDRTIWTASYGSALFWTYLMEQYGAVATEPARGIDFIKRWWELARDRIANPSIVDVTDAVIKQTHPDDNVTNAYHDFLITNTMKGRDLSQVSSSFRQRYSYRDEDPIPGNKMVFKEAKISGALNVPTNGMAASVATTAKRFGARYYNFVTQSCPTGNTLEFSVNPTVLLPLPGNGQAVLPDGLYALIAIEGQSGPGKPRKLYKQRNRSWTQRIVQPANHYNRITVAVAGWHSDFAGTLSMKCLAPPPLPLVAQVSSSQPLVLGTPGSGSLATFSVDVRTPDGGGFDTLDLDDLSISVDVPGQAALLLPAVQKVREAAARMKVSVMLLPNLPLGTYDAQVHAAGYDTSFSGGVYVGAHQPQVIVAVDTSSSMGTPSGATRLQSVKTAAQSLGQRLPASARLGLLRFAGSTVGAPNASVVTPLATLSAAQRSQWLGDLAALVPDSALTIKLSDVLVSSITAFNAQTAVGERHLLVLTDGGDAPGLDVDALAAQARTASVRMHFVALGSSADQPLLARLASQTGGSYQYVDVPAGGIERSALVGALAQIGQRIDRSQIVASGSATTTLGSPAVIPILIDSATDSASGGPRVKVFDGQTGTAFSAVRLYRPDNSQVVAGGATLVVQNGQSFAFHVPNAPTGQWRLEVDPPSAGGTLAFDYRAAVIDPARSLQLAFSRVGGDNEAVEYFRVGEPVLVQAGVRVAVGDLSGDAAPSSAVATLNKPGMGTPILNLRDDGSGGDQFAGDGVYSAIYRATDSGSPTAFLDNQSASPVRGSVNVDVQLNVGTRAAPKMLGASGSFAVMREASVADADSDGLPDRYEQRQECLNPSVADASADRDGDGASTAAEYAAGSNPCEVDSDGGGETDGSEIAQGSSPLDSSDDAVARIRQVEIRSQQPDHEEVEPLPAFAHSLRFDSDPAHASILVKRAASAAGPFLDHVVIDATSADGLYVDGGLTGGQTWCYQLIGRTAGGRSAAASDTVCAVARADSTAPRGSIILNDGAPRSSSASLVAQLQIDGEPAIGMQMRLTLPDGSDSGWIAYSPSVGISAASLGAPAVATATVIFRDASGNESEQYVDDIDLVTASSVGSISGELRIDTRFGTPDAPLAGVSVLPANTMEAGTSSNASGQFTLAGLEPGTYTLTLELPGYDTRLVANITVTGGGTQSLGVLRLVPSALFRNGFED